MLQIKTFWCHGTLKKMAQVSTKQLLEKSEKTKKLKDKKNNENVYNLWRILGTKQVLLVDF